MQAGNVRPFQPILEAGLTELIDQDDTAVAINGSYSKSVSFDIGSETSGTKQAIDNPTSGEILGVLLVSSEAGTGAIQTGAASLYLFDADPAISAGDTDLAEAGAEHKALVGIVTIEAAEWSADDNGGAVFKTVAIPFHALNTIYAAYYNTDSSANWNSVAGDNEELHMNFWYRRES